MPMKYRPFDSRLEHRAAGSAALTSDTTLATVNQRGETRTEFVTKVVVESIDTTTGDETYEVVIELSNDNFTTVDAVAASRLMGDATQLRSATDTAVGDEFEIFWTTEVADTVYQDWRVVLDVSGTSPSMGLICYSTVME